MTRKEKYLKCKDFFDGLSMILYNDYEILSSCNQDLSAYLCPIGTCGEVSYYGKPENSFRISDHWNWYSNTKKCENYNYIQCYSRQLPYAKKRIGKGKASDAIKATSVGIFQNGIYHVIYGETYDRKTRKWSWIESNPNEVLSKYLKES